MPSKNSRRRRIDTKHGDISRDLFEILPLTFIKHSAAAVGDKNKKNFFLRSVCVSPFPGYKPFLLLLLIIWNIVGDTVKGRWIGT